MTKALLIAKLGFKIEYKQIIRKITPLISGKIFVEYFAPNINMLFMFSI